MSMTLSFFTNLLHHHQTPVADEFYRVLGDSFHFIVTEPLPETFVKGGYDPNITRPYVIKAYENDAAQKEADSLLIESDVVIFSYGNKELLLERKKQNKITFHYSERWLKNHCLRHFMPHILAHIYRHYFQFRNKRTYMLCASAFTAQDVRKFFCFPRRCFKWGYFTRVDSIEPEKIVNVNEAARDDHPSHIMWCARFLRLKHPELPIMLAKRLKDKGYRFKLDMFGEGEQLAPSMQLAADLNVEDVVSFRGVSPNEEILRQMRQHEIFLFTSDRNEGWGAVANEAMSNGCAIVGSNAIGSIPYLVQDGINGLVFESENLDSLEEKVIFLLDNPYKCSHIREEALRTMQEVWSPTNAAKRFLTLVDYIQKNRLQEYSISEGPASWV
jgi:glycosyltransferase involved in cell wall biosynthesis